MARELRFDLVGGICPVRAEGHFGGKPFYFRSRGDKWFFGIGGKNPVLYPEWKHEEAYGTFPEAGYITCDKAKEFVVKALTIYCTQMGYKPPP